jgi:transposase
VIDLSTEKDPDILRQLALLQERELELLHKKLSELCAEIDRLKGVGTGELELQLKQIEKTLNEARGDGSNKEPSTQKRRRSDTKKLGPKRGHGPTKQTELEVVETIYELDKADEICPACGGKLKPWEGQFEESELVDVIERRYILRKVKRQKYVCQCGSCVDTAEGPERLVSGGRYSLDFAVAVAISKYIDHLPLERQVRQMARLGLEVTSQTLWDQLWRLASLLQPNHEALLQHVLAQPVIGLDQTGWPKLTKGASKPWQMWCLTASDAVYHCIKESKSTEATLQVLGDFTGTAVCDAMSSHAAAARDGPGFRLANCWAHVRRKFADCESSFPEASEMLELIGELYAVEARAADGEDLAALRATESVAVLGRIRDWLHRCRALPRSALGKAVRYTLANWSRLTVFADDPDVWLDNNLTERSLRGPVVGRRNHFGSKSKRGTKAAAILYSLVETAKLRGVDPAEYLANAARVALRATGTVILPKEVTAEQNPLQR